MFYTVKNYFGTFQVFLLYKHLGQYQEQWIVNYSDEKLAHRVGAWLAGCSVRQHYAE